MTLEHTTANRTNPPLRRADVEMMLAEIENPWELNLRNQVMTDIDLSEMYLPQGDLADADLSRANLYRTSLAGARLTQANLAGADLSGAELFEANLAGANLSGANLTRAGLFDANLTGADLSEANLTEADLSVADFDVPDDESEERKGAAEGKLFIQFAQEPLTAWSLSTLLTALADLHTRCWLIHAGRFEDVARYATTRDPDFMREANLVIATISKRSPLELKVDLSPQALAEAIKTGVETAALTGARRKQAALENRQRELEIEIRAGEAEQEAAQREQELDLQRRERGVEIERKRLDLERTRLEQHLGCRCASEACHGDVLTEHAKRNPMPPGGARSDS